MRWLRAKRAGWAAWFGVLALALNALVPIHLAFDLVEALGPAHHAHADGDAVRRVLALIVLHDDGGHADADHHGDHHHGDHRHGSDCPVCSALGSLAAFAMPVAPPFALPVATAGAAAALPAEAEPVTAFPTGYRSRAPPLS